MQYWNTRTLVHMQPNMGTALTSARATSRASSQIPVHQSRMPMEDRNAAGTQFNSRPVTNCRSHGGQLTSALEFPPIRPTACAAGRKLKTTLGLAWSPKMTRRTFQTGTSSANDSLLLHISCRPPVQAAALRLTSLPVQPLPLSVLRLPAPVCLHPISLSPLPCSCPLLLHSTGARALVLGLRWAQNWSRIWDWRRSQSCNSAWPLGLGPSVQRCALPSTPGCLFRVPLWQLVVDVHQ